LADADDDAILEFGRALAEGVTFASPVFDGALESDIKTQLRVAGLPSSGKIQLSDGKLGEAFEQLVTVGLTSTC
jgi:DNA-directed RNA polymerase subunit beta